MERAAYHSFSDTINQVLLLIGISRSTRSPDKKHPFGYGKVQFFYAFVVAMLIFGVAGGLSIREGIHKLLFPEPVEHVLLIYISLGIAFFFETIALHTAYKELRAEMKEEGITNILKAVRESKDPTILTVVFEDTLALVSVIIAAVSVSLSYYLHNSVFDAIGSLIIGVALMIFALLLAVETKKLLIGESVSESKQQKILAAIKQVQEVKEVIDLRTMHLGPKQVIVAAEVNIDDTLTTNQVEKVIDSIEQNIRKIVPQSYCYVEAEGIVHCTSSLKTAH